MLNKKNLFVLAVGGALVGLLSALTVRADTPYSSTGWVDAVLAPGIVCTNALGQVLLRANVHTARVESSDARMIGNRLILCDGAYNADGTANLQGTCYQQVGTWDAYGTNFTATGGLWEINYRGVMQTNNSLQLSFAGYGSGGAIDGQRIEETMTRGPASGLIDFTVPYVYAGTIKPPPLNTSEVLDNFDDNVLTDWVVKGNGQFFNTNQQLNVRGYYPGVHTDSFLDSFVLGGHPTTWTVPDGQTREWRADLVRLDENATNTATLAVGTTSGLYSFRKGRDFVFITKWSPSSGFSIFACERAAIRNTNVVLALALTRVQPNLVITARVLDKADPNTVLYQCTVVDTPSVDPTLNTAQFQALTGMRLLDLGPDAAGAPFTSFAATVGVFQYTDGSQPAVLATFDNLELRTSEIPAVGIERAVRVTWPDVGSYTVEAAPTVQGPYLPFQDTTPPGMNQMTVPTTQLLQFFRLRQAP